MSAVMLIKGNELLILVIRVAFISFMVEHFVTHE